MPYNQRNNIITKLWSRKSFSRILTDHSVALKKYTVIKEITLLLKCGLENLLAESWQITSSHKKIHCNQRNNIITIVLSRQYLDRPLTDTFSHRKNTLYLIKEITLLLNYGVEYLLSVSWQNTRVMGSCGI